MRPEEEIKKKSAACYQAAVEKKFDAWGKGSTDYYSGAWHALAWVLGEDVEI